MLVDFVTLAKNTPSLNKLIAEIKHSELGYTLPSDNLKVISQRIEKTMTTFPILTVPCEDVLQSMQDMTMNLRENIYALWGPKELPSFQQYVSIYFSRNITYLQSAYLLASGSLCGPSRDLLRTIYETILRGYLFIVDHKEADLMYAFVEKKLGKEELVILRKRNFWPFNFVVKKLYTVEARKQHKKFFGTLSRFSHPSILGVFKDVEYSNTGVEECLNGILNLAFGNIQMLSEGFFDLLEPALKKIIKETLLEIADSQGEIALFEPDQKQWSPKIKLKKVNFMTILK